MTQQSNVIDRDLEDGELFSVYHWGFDEEQHREKYLVPLPEAFESVKHHISNVAARMGMTHRVVMVDAMDLTVFEWKFGEGIIFPPALRKH